jgi:hypothetical protein
MFGLLLGLFVCLGIFGYWGIWLPLHSSGYDFTGPYEAGYALAHHAALQVYDVPMQRIFNAQVLHLPDGPSDFRWTPPSAALLIPFGFLPYSVAHILWWMLSLAALLVSLWLLARCITTTARKAGRVLPTWVIALTLFAAVALSQPVTDSLRLGQSTTFLLLGFAMVVYGAVEDRPMVAGVGLAIAILDKLFPGILLLFFLWRGNYRLCLAAIATICLLIVATLPFTGVGMYGAFVEALRTYSNQPNAGPVNLSLYHALIVLAAALLHPGTSEPTGGPLPILSLLVCLALFGVMLLAQGTPDILRRLRPVRTGNHTDAPKMTMTPLFAVSWAICSLVIVEPIVWIFYYILLLVPLAWLMTTLGTDGRGRAQGWLLAGLVGYFIATLVFPLDPRTAVPMSAVYILGITAHPTGLALVWVAHAGYYLHARRSTPYLASAADSIETNASGTMIPRASS